MSGDHSLKTFVHVRPATLWRCTPVFSIFPSQERSLHCSRPTAVSAVLIDRSCRARPLHFASAVHVRSVSNPPAPHVFAARINSRYGFRVNLKHRLFCGGVSNLNAPRLTSSSLPRPTSGRSCCLETPRILSTRPHRFAMVRREQNQSLSGPADFARSFKILQHTTAVMVRMTEHRKKSSIRRLFPKRFMGSHT